MTLDKALRRARAELVDALDPEHYRGLRGGLVAAMRPIQEAVALEPDRNAIDVLSVMEGGLIQDDLLAVRAFTEQAKALLDGLIVGYEITA